ncbi:MAG: hypothetical protein ACRC2T_16460, partial [Thermoguttaceae bacterium]
MTKTTQNLWVLIFSVFFISSVFGGLVVAGYFQYWRPGDASSQGGGKAGAAQTRRAPAALVRVAEAKWEVIG